MAERRKTQRKAKNPASGTADAKPESEAKLETEAKREAESKSGAKGRGGSKQAKKAEEKGAAQAEQKAAGEPKASATKRKSTAAEATSKTAGTKAAEKGKAPAKGKSTGKKPAAAKTRAAAKKDVGRPVVNARARYVRIAPRKARLIADQVRGMTLEEAETLLRFSPRSAAGDMAKLLASAAANAENNHDLVADDLVIKDIHVDEGPTLRRYRPRALGRATRINKRTSHIHVALTPEE